VRIELGGEQSRGKVGGVKGGGERGVGRKREGVDKVWGRGGGERGEMEERG